ncbi:hypothetical protein KCU87_g11, partial [Aureobasidium melanogenum]
MAGARMPACWLTGADLAIAFSISLGQHCGLVQLVRRCQALEILGVVIAVGSRHGPETRDTITKFGNLVVQVVAVSLLNDIMRSLLDWRTTIFWTLRLFRLLWCW